MHLAMITTSAYNPPELKENQQFDVDKFHAYVLGKNLYQYLTGDVLIGNPKDLKEQFADLPHGEKYAELIEGLTQEDPQKRMSVSDALKQFNHIALSEHRALCIDAKKTMGVIRERDKDAQESAEELYSKKN